MSLTVNESWVCGACTTAQIHDVGEETDAPTAMLRFCEQALKAEELRYNLPCDYKKLFCFYVFTSGPDEPGFGHSKTWAKYGSEFAEYIKRKKLGKIVTPGRTVNYRFHATTTCQTWVWMPDRDALIKWYKRAQRRLNGKKEEK